MGCKQNPRNIAILSVKLFACQLSTRFGDQVGNLGIFCCWESAYEGWVLGLQDQSQHPLNAFFLISSLPIVLTLRSIVVTHFARFVSMLEIRAAPFISPPFEFPSGVPPAHSFPLKSHHAKSYRPVDRLTPSTRYEFACRRC